MILFLKAFFNNIQSFFDELFQFECLNCKDEIINYGICHKCWQKIHFIHQSCLKCSYPLPNDKNKCPACIKDNFILLNKIKSIAIYDDVIKNIVHSFKYKDHLQVGKFLTSLMYQKYKTINKCDFIIPTPMSKVNLINRTFNQTAIICQKFLQFDNEIKYIPDLLIKKSDKKQIELNYKERKKRNHKIKLNEKYLDLIKNKKILLIEDVITTGSTINACAKAIKKLSPDTQIFCISFARTVI